VIRSRAFLRAYRFLPHALLNRGLAILTRARRPHWLVERAIAEWVRRDRIALDDFAPRRFATVEDFFLRELRPGARPLADGVVAPVDGRVVAAGAFDAGARLDVKGCALSLARVVNGRHHDLALDGFRGGSYASLFLSPRGYHHVHAPVDGELVDARWIPGRYFPQNEIALREIARVYERNERLTLRIRVQCSNSELLLVMVGASLIGGIELDGIARRDFTRRGPLAIGRRVVKGERLGHFTFGSTVIVIAPPPFALDCRVGSDVLLGQRIGSFTARARDEQRRSDEDGEDGERDQLDAQ
jgi:phosphatidylserine decarboxylase